MTLEQIIAEEKKNRTEDGMFGIKACKEHIEFEVRYCNENLFGLLQAFYEIAKEDKFFNRAMILACWELINEQ